MPLADHLFAELRAQADPNTLAGRARLAEFGRPLLALPEAAFSGSDGGNVCARKRN